MKMKQWKQKSVSLLLACSIFASVLHAFPAGALQPDTAETTTLTPESQLWHPEDKQMLPNTEGDLTPEQLKTAALADEDRPEVIDETLVAEKEHVNRLYQQESDLNTIVFQNRDGKKTMYYFSEPVKYQAADGSVRDKSNALTESAEDFANLENDINTYFPKKLHKNKGVVLRHKDIEIETSPLIKGNSGASRQTGKDKGDRETTYVEYPDVFDKTISVRYTPTFSGYKEDIILEEYAGIHEFTFRVKTNGLQMTERDGAVLLSDPLTGEIKLTYSPVYVYDSFTGERTEEKPHESYDNFVYIETVQADQEYLLTVTVDEEFLTDPETVYPVVVDPSVTAMPKGAIQDAAVYSNVDYVMPAAEYREIKIGCNSLYGAGRGLYYFPLDMFNLDMIHLYGNQITSATLHLYYSAKESKETIESVSLYEFLAPWSVNTVKWNTTNPDAIGKFVDSQQVGRVSEYTDFDISSLMQKFKTDPDYTADFDGLILKANRENAVWRKFVSSEGESGRRPYISMTYNDQPTKCPQVESGGTYLIGGVGERYLTNRGTNQMINAPLNGTFYQRFKIVNVTGAEYEIYPVAFPSMALSSDGSSVYIDTDGNLSSQRWHIYHRDGLFHFVNKAYPGKLMDWSYDTPNGSVVLDSNYDNCCWGLEKKEYCGGTNYKDVTKHKMVFRKADNHYVCSTCAYRVKSPELQDKDVLTTYDYLRSVALMEYVSQCEILADRNAATSGYYSILSNNANTALNTIRSNGMYKNKYEYRNSAGICHVTETNDLLASGVDVIDITPLNIGLYNGTYTSVATLVIGLYCPEVALLLDVTSLVTQQMNALDFGAFVLGLIEDGSEKLSRIATGLSIASIFLGSVDSDIAVGDKLVRINVDARSSALCFFDCNNQFKEMQIIFNG